MRSLRASLLQETVLLLSALSPWARPAVANTVRIDAEDAYLADIGAAVWIVQSPKIDVPYALDVPVPPAGVTVGTASSLSPGLGSVSFGASETQSSQLQVFNSEPFVLFAPGWEARSGYVALTSTPPGVDVGSPSLLWIAEVREAGFVPRGGDGCFICLGIFVLCGARYGDAGECWAGNPCHDASSSRRAPAPPALDERPVTSGDFDFSWVTTLRRYRDEIMALTSQGRFYTDLYQNLSLELTRALFASPSLPARLYRMHTEWAPGFQALVDGVGDGFTISQSMQDDLLSLLDALEAGGSPTLASTLAFERSRLQIDHIAGLSMTGFQQQIETLGGTSALAPQSWGRVKALYRE